MPYNRMDHYSQLVAFVSASENGSFSAAARAKNLSPSAISKLVSALEDRLRVRLFHRGARNLTLTPEGQAYLPRAKAVLDAMAEADSLGDTLPSKIAGTIRLHTMASFAKHQILPWLPDFLAAHKSVFVELQLGAQYIDKFDDGLDLAIHSGFIPDSSRIAKSLGDSEWIVCASPDYLRRCGEPQHPTDLVKHTCFSFAFASNWNEWAFKIDDRLQTIAVKPSASFTQGDLIRELALSGSGVVRLADFHVGDDIRAGKLVPLLRSYRSGLTETVYMIYANRRHLSPRIKAFRDHLEAQLKGRPWSI